MSHAGQVARITRALGADAGLAGRVAGLQGGDVRAFLLDVAARRAARLRPADVLRRYEGTPALRPSPVDPAALRRLEGWAMERLPAGFAELALSPHAPLGVSSVLGGFSQDRALATIADGEIVSDTTNVLALECARRRRDPDARRRGDATRLAAAHRLLRPREGAHFALVALCTAARDRGSFTTQTDALREHLDWHVRVVATAAPGAVVAVAVTDLSGGARRAALEAEVLRPLRTAWPAVAFGFDDDRVAGRGYYVDACFAVDVVDAGGTRANLSDGGLTDWTARLLADGKERLLISGLGTERLVGVAAATG